MGMIQESILNMPDELFWTDEPLLRQQHNAARLAAGKTIATLTAERDEAKWMYEGLTQHHTDAVDFLKRAEAERDRLQAKLREVCEALKSIEILARMTSDDRIAETASRAMALAQQAAPTNERGER